jgi:trigger factor
VDEMENKSTKQFGMWALIIIVVIAAMFALSKFVTTEAKIDPRVSTQVEQIIKQSKVMYATKETKKPIVKGDVVEMDFVGLIDNKEFEGGSAKKQRIEIGSGTFIPGFEEQLIGKKTGDKVDVNVTFPKDYAQKQYAGKKALFKVTINNVLTKASDDEVIAKMKETLKTQLPEISNVNDMNQMKKMIADILVKQLEASQQQQQSQTQQQTQQ